jgi:hypothetical protein
VLAVLRHADAPIAALGHLVAVVHRDRQGLACCGQAVGDLDDELVKVVPVGIGRRVVVGRRDEAQFAGEGIDREQAWSAPPTML